MPKIKERELMYTLNCKGRLLRIDKPVVMGIINCTPDSFYKGSRKQDIDEILRTAEKMINEGATILDIGGQSTRPGSKQEQPDEEMKRVIPAIQKIAAHYPDVILSIDTFYSLVAKNAIEAGASIINDISAGNADAEMLTIAAKYKVPYIAMHMQGKPETMQLNPVYENVTREVLDYFIKKTEQCRLAGINDIIIDPGFGFGKTLGHNFELLKNLEVFKILNCPVLAGISRKSMITKTLGITADNALNGTTVLNTIALQKGANILRVHDVKEAVEAIGLVEEIKS